MPLHTRGELRVEVSGQRSAVSGLWEGAGDGAEFSRTRTGRLLPALPFSGSRRATTDVTHECPSS